MATELQARAVNVKEARRLLGNLGRNKIYDLLSEGKLRSVKIGRHYLIPVTSIDDFLQQ
jgi:excisionase family DNA binding protein